MGKKPKTEYRVVCVRFGTQGHSGHVKTKPTKAKAKQSVIDQNHHAELHPDHFYAREAPYRIQTRETTAWEDEE